MISIDTERPRDLSIRSHPLLIHFLSWSLCSSSPGHLGSPPMRWNDSSLRPLHLLLPLPRDLYPEILSQRMQSPSFCSPKFTSLERGLPWSCFPRACLSSPVVRSVRQELRPPANSHRNEPQGIWLSSLSQAFKRWQPWLTSDFPDHSPKSDDSPSPQTPITLLFCCSWFSH